jgi:DNA-binding CsgD family transcriptional regulator
MTTGKLEILKNKFEKASDEFRVLGFYRTMFFKHDLDGEFNYCHLPDNCIFTRGTHIDANGVHHEILDRIIRYWPENAKCRPMECKHTPLKNKNGDESAAFLIQPYDAEWNCLSALSTLDSLCNEMFSYFADIEENGVSLLNDQKSFSCEEKKELKESLYRTDICKTGRSLLATMFLRSIPKMAIGTHSVPAKPGQSYCQKSEDVFLDFAFLCTDLIDSIKSKSEKNQGPCKTVEQTPKAKRRKRNASSKLSRRETQVYRMIHVENKTQQQTAIELECTPQNVSKHLRNAEKKMAAMNSRSVSTEKAQDLPHDKRGQDIIEG